MDQQVVLPRHLDFRHRHTSNNYIVHLLKKEIKDTSEITLVKIGRNKAKLIKLSDGQDILVVKNKNIRTHRDKVLFSRNLYIPSTSEELSSSGCLRWIRPILSVINLSDPSELELRCKDITSSWKDKFLFTEEEKISETEIKKGFRSAQIGAVHAVLAHWKVSDKPATIVMPTGTGKTETMLALLVHQQLNKLLVVVPTDALRTQISDKFIELGLLQELNMLGGDIQYPIVGIFEHQPKTEEELFQFFKSCNVVVTTIGVVRGLSDAMQDKISELCSHLFIDEAHHIPAPSWDKFRAHFRNKPILQFTATPFRSDGRHIDGKIIYNFPLNKAQEQGYFKPINFVALRIYNKDRVDEEIALKAISQLDQDIASGFNHVVMARADNTDHADEIIEIYKRLAPGYNPLIIHNKIKRSDRKQFIQNVKNGQSRIVVCVDMFGEGFDFPEFKIAAMHDIHKSLAITLQFTGRFVRTRSNIGDATIIANVANPDVEDALKELFAEDSNWNKILRTLNEGRTNKEERKSEFFEGFSDAPEEVPVESILPKMSTVVYKTTCLNWQPEKVTDVIKTSKIYAGPTINNEHRIFYFVTREQEHLDWANLKEITNIIWNLYLFYWDKANNLLYVNSTNNHGYHEALAKAVCGSNVELIKGELIFRALKGVNRLTLMNLGLKHVLGKAVRFTMHAGMDVSGGLADAAVQNKIKSNLFGRGFEDGNKTSIGCSYKGRIWAYKIADSIDEWAEWCRKNGSKLQNPSIDPDTILKNALVPEEITERPNMLPLSIDWSEEVFLTPEDMIQFDFSGQVVPFFETSIGLVNPSKTGSIAFNVFYENIFAKYEIQISTTGVLYARTEGEEINVITRRERMPLEDWLKLQPPTLLFEDGSLMSDDRLLKVNYQNVPPFDINKIIVWNWGGTDLSKESQTVTHLTDSIQYKVIRELLSSEIDYDLIFDDDSSGEAADVLAFKLLGDKLIINLFHCKYSHDSIPGARIDDLYEVCGQAQKSVNWKCDIQKLIRHLRKREVSRINKNVSSRFQKGDMRLLDEIEAKSPVLLTDFGIQIVQPGLSKSKISDDQLKLLASTELYLQETYAIKLNVIASS